MFCWLLQMQKYSVGQWDIAIRKLLCKNKLVILTTCLFSEQHKYTSLHVAVGCVFGMYIHECITSDIISF